MKKLSSTTPKGYFEDGVNTEEAVHVFEFENEDECDEFGFLSHKEQLDMMGFKEESTPSKGTVHRYSIDPGDVYVVVRETTMKW